MKVAMVAPDIHTEKGIAIYAMDLVDAIRKQGIRIDYIGYKKGSFSSFMGIIPKLRDYDLVHIQHEYNLFGRFAGILFIPFIITLGLVKKGKLIITMHTVISKKERLFPYIPWWSWIKKTFIYPVQNKLIGLFSSKIVMHANFLAETLVKNYNIKRSKIVVIPHGVRENVKIFDKNKAKHELKLSGNIYLMMGNIHMMKGTDIIVKLARRIGKTIVIAGHPSLKINTKYIKEIQDFIKVNHLEEIIRFDTRGIDSKSRLWSLYFSAADLVLMPYRKMTTSGIFIESMAFRKPAITSDRRYFREVRKDFKCLTIVKQDSDYPKTIRKAMKPHVLKIMEKESERYVEEFSLTSVGKKYKLFYESVIRTKHDQLF